MNVLIACEVSGIVRDAFRDKGHNAWSCDILPSDDPFAHHFCGDVMDLIAMKEWYFNATKWDLMIAHPPCTYLCNSGVRWLHEREGRWDDMRKGAEFFKELLNAPIPKICIENPIMHRYAKEIIGKGQDQIIQPWQHGHGETKATCLWLKNLPLLTPSDVVEGREGRIHKLPPSKDRGHLRSITYRGIARAFANQWGDI